VSGAPRIAGGIVASRVLGLVREAVIEGVAGVGALTDVLAVAFRAPNVLQNLLGDQALSASFIPTYSRLLAEGRRREAGALAGAIFGLLLSAMAALSLVGVLLAPQIVRLLAAGFAADAEAVAAGTEAIDRLELATTAVRICFPMVAAITLSAWCLGVLSRRRAASVLGGAASGPASCGGSAHVPQPPGRGRSDDLGQLGSGDRRSGRRPARRLR